MNTLFLQISLGFFLLLVSSYEVIATPQICKTELRYNSKYYTFDSPLDNFPNFSEKLERKLNVFLKCSACWSGYSSHWEINDSTLYLTAIYSSLCHKDINFHKAVEKVVKAKFIDGKLKASWFNDTIWITTTSKLIDSSYTYFPIKRKSYKDAPLKQTGLIFQDGTIVGQTTSEYVKCKEKDLLPIQDFVYSNMSWDSLPELSNRSINVRIQYEHNEYGKITNVNALESDSLGYSSEISRILYIFPCLDVYYHGTDLIHNTRYINFEISDSISTKFR